MDEPILSDVPKFIFKLTEPPDDHVAEFTTDDRIARFRAWVLAKPSPSSGNDLSMGSNVLLGATLHGLARRSKGAKDLTDAERTGVKLLEILSGGEEELIEYGKLYLEAKSLRRSGGALSVKIPPSILDLADDAPYTDEKFKDDLQSMAVETLSQPHIRVVKPHDVQPNGKVSKAQDFEAAVVRLKRGVSLFAADKDLIQAAGADEHSEGEKRPSVGFTIRPTDFSCVRKSLEHATDGIYFSWGYGGDQKSEIAHRTFQFRSIESGSSQCLHPKPSIYEGFVDACAAGHIACWEADQDSKTWYDKLTALMWAIAASSSLMTMSADDNNWESDLVRELGPIAHIGERAMWLENISTLVAALLEWASNRDNLVTEHTHGYHYHFITEMVSSGREMDFEFGGGKYGNFVIRGKFVKPRAVAGGKR